MDELNKWEMERSQKDRQHRELMKQNRILATTTDKHAHALNTIIEWAEFHKNKDRDENSFNIDYYYFNFEDRMDDLEMLKKFLTELENNDCFEKYERTNYTDGTKFSFIKVNIKNLKKFREEMIQKEKSFPKISLESAQINYNDDTGIIKVGKQNIVLPPYKNEHYFCQIMFEYKIKEPVSWDIIYDRININPVSGLTNKKREQTKIRGEAQKVYDTMKRTNRRIKEVANTDDNLFSWKEKTIIRNY